MAIQPDLVDPGVVYTEHYITPSHLYIRTLELDKFEPW